MCYYIIHSKKSVPGVCPGAVRPEDNMRYELKTEFDDVLVADGAMITGDVTIGPMSSVWYNVVIRGDEGPIEIGRETSIQDCAVIHYITKIGDHCTVGHGAIVHGCTIGNNVLVGMGAKILTGARIGNNCLIGAGALVTGKMNAPDGSFILGSPARIVRECTPQEIESITLQGDEYVELTKRWLDKE